MKRTEKDWSMSSDLFRIHSDKGYGLKRIEIFRNESDLFGLDIGLSRNESSLKLVSNSFGLVSDSIRFIRFDAGYTRIEIWKDSRIEMDSRGLKSFFGLISYSFRSGATESTQGLKRIKKNWKLPSD